ncbi:MAG TPA: hypothetical protein VND64_17630 [Pirellulales bacterium]|nr:hypothetical protein [Pirellulales bacterium]
MCETNPKQPAPEGNADPMAADQENSERRSLENSEQGSLDEAWAGLAQLLNANAMPLNRAALIDAVCRRLARRTHHRRQVVLALAASLLAAVGGTWMAMPRDDAQVVVLPSEAPSGKVTIGPNVKAATLNPAALSPTAETSAPQSVWNDDWDDELALAKEEVLVTEEGWRQPADWLAAVREQMDELEAEFREGAL